MNIFRKKTKKPTKEVQRTLVAHPGVEWKVFAKVKAKVKH